MRALDPAVITALSSGVVAIATFVKIDFPSATIALNSSTWDLVYGGTTYLGAEGLGSISPINDTPGELPGLQLSLLNVDSAHIAIALDDADEVQGSPVTIRTAIIDPTTYQVLDAPTVWVGYADKMVIGEDGQKATIGLTAESKAVDLLRGNPLTYSDADHRSIFANDRAFEYVVDQSSKPVVWPKREWYLR